MALGGCRSFLLLVTTQNLSDVRSETCAVFDIRGSCDAGLFVLSGTLVQWASSECT